MRTYFPRKSKPIVGVIPGSPHAGEELKKELALHVRKEIGPIAVPDKIQAYTALSRCRTLESLTLCRPLRDSDILTDERATQFYARHLGRSFP